MVSQIYAYPSPEGVGNYGSLLVGHMVNSDTCYGYVGVAVLSVLCEYIVYHVCHSERYRCNRLRCPLARMSGLQCFNMGHNGHGINLYGVSMTLMGN